METTSGKKSMKLVWTAIIFALLMPLLLWYELENYHMHYGTGMLTSLCTLVGICINAYTFIKNIRAAVKKKSPNLAEMICSLIALIVCIAVFAAAQKIPVCVECDHLTSEDLGFLSRWIKGIDIP